VTSGEISGVPSRPGNVIISNDIKLVSKPGVESWGNINVANMYKNSYDYDRAKESHLIKNSEWGATAYLTHSKYGRNTTEIAMNNSSYYTGGGEEEAYKINTNQSSTGNVYGIYDLNGNSYENTAAFNSKYSGTRFTESSFASTGGISTKYATAYSNDSNISNATNIIDFNTGRNVSITGDGIKEVWRSTTASWFMDYATFVDLESPFYVRGRLSWIW